MKPRSALAAILTMRCPKCREGKMFPTGTLYSTQFMKMNKTCSCCGQPFMPEPGYYFGAMFISYAINAGFFFVIWLGMYFTMETITMTAIIIALFAVILGLLPVTFRLSRVLWIHLFVGYKGPGGITTDPVQ